jgi:hypothetical protein
MTGISDGTRILGTAKDLIDLAKKSENIDLQKKSYRIRTRSYYFGI